tara:strand:- start:257 stop:511 length:255 start_codon:yes stop_codon:yes gene_type:complete
LNHPLAGNLRELDDGKLDDRIKDLAKKINFAYRSSPSVVPQMQMMMEDLQAERGRREKEKMEKVMQQAKEANGDTSNWDDIIDI